MFDKQQLAIRREHAEHFLKRRTGIGYGAQRPSGYEGIDAVGVDREGLR